ncbi:MAG: hypothetical protein WCP33_03295 [Deltaproteobacteria bacterium]
MKHIFNHIGYILLVVVLTVIAPTRFVAAANGDEVAVRQQNMSTTSTVEVVDSTNDQVKINVARNFADQNEQQVGQIKSTSRNKRILLTLLAMGSVVFLYLNLVATGDNARYCYNCLYSGPMKPVKLANNGNLNSVLMFIVKFLPIFQYVYPRSVRYICPVCNRTSKSRPVV